METLSLIGNAFAGMMNPMSILLLIVGVAVGIVFGSIPGLSAAMAVALFLPVTFAMQAHEAFTLLVALYIGGISGGLISAILINIPGTSSSIATCFDGSPMAKKGEAGKALGTGVVFSFLGGLFSFLVLMFVAPSVAQITLKFSAIEYFGVCLFALSMIAALAGTSMIKAGIFDRDVVIVKKTPVAENGDIVVALVGDEATVKRIFVEKDHIRLQPENDEFEPIIVKEAVVLGKVVSLLRYF